MLQAARLVRVGSGLRACGSGSASLLGQHGFATDADGPRHQGGDPQHQAERRQEGGGGGGRGWVHGSRERPPRKQRPRSKEFPLEDAEQINKKIFPAYICNVNSASAAPCRRRRCLRSSLGGRALAGKPGSASSLHPQLSVVVQPHCLLGPAAAAGTPCRPRALLFRRACCARTLLLSSKATTCRSKRSGGLAGWWQGILPATVPLVRAFSLTPLHWQLPPP